jgi:hypothetical protein
VEGIGAHFGQDVVGSSEPVADGHAFQSGEEPSCSLGLYNLLGDGGSVLAAVALSEDDEGVGSGDGEVLGTKAALDSVVEFVQSSVEIVSNF